MDRKIIAGILALVLAAIGIGMLFPGTPGEQRRPGLMPWQIEPLPDGTSRIFGVTLGRTTLRESEGLFGDEPEVSLFVADGRYAAEAYYEEVWLSGLKAKVVLALDVPQETLAGYYDRGARIAKTESGGSKVTLGSADRRALDRFPVGAITYIPAAALDEELIGRRFGEPAERLAEGEEATHYLYPSKGLDIALSAKGKAVLQYLPPARFEELAAPLRGGKRG